MIILKVTKNQRFTLSLENTFWKKTLAEDQIDTPPPPSLLRVQVYFAYYSVSCKLFEISSPYIFMLVEAPKHALTCDSSGTLDNQKWFYFD